MLESIGRLVTCKYKHRLVCFTGGLVTFISQCTLYSYKVQFISVAFLYSYLAVFVIGVQNGFFIIIILHYKTI